MVGIQVLLLGPRLERVVNRDKPGSAPSSHYCDWSTLKPDENLLSICLGELTICLGELTYSG